MTTELPKYTIQMNIFEAGVLLGMIEVAKERIKASLSEVRSQLIARIRVCEEAAGVVKKLLPSGVLEIKDKDGNLIIRPPYSWEVESN